MHRPQYTSIHPLTTTTKILDYVRPTPNMHAMLSMATIPIYHTRSYLPHSTYLPYLAPMRRKRGGRRCRCRKPLPQDVDGANATARSRVGWGEAVGGGGCIWQRHETATAVAPCGGSCGGRIGDDAPARLAPWAMLAMLTPLPMRPCLPCVSASGLSG
jgi:hypothetical protein